MLTAIQERHIDLIDEGRVTGYINTKGNWCYSVDSGPVLYSTITVRSLIKRKFAKVLDSGKVTIVVDGSTK